MAVRSTTAVSGSKGAEEKDDALSAYCVDLNEKAREGGVDPLIGREHEVERCIQVLCRRRDASRRSARGAAGRPSPGFARTLATSSTTASARARAGCPAPRRLGGGSMCRRGRLLLLHGAAARWDDGL